MCALPSGCILFTQKIHAKTNPIGRNQTTKKKRKVTVPKHASFNNKPQDKRERRSKEMKQSRDDKEKKIVAKEKTRKA